MSIDNMPNQESGYAPAPKELITVAHKKRAMKAYGITDNELRQLSTASTIANIAFAAASFFFSRALDMMLSKSAASEGGIQNWIITFWAITIICLLFGLYFSLFYRHGIEKTIRDESPD
jgi:hypothetical protein